MDDPFKTLDELQDAPLKRAESIPPNDVHAPIDPGPDDCAERPECALSFADLARMRVEAGDLPSQEDSIRAAKTGKFEPPVIAEAKTFVAGDQGF